ncbi:MAG: 2-C-methyl-D-erythritol 4-phosphate cytidylyltransferase [Gammaproteobacteria bacterium]|nr:2-C-methyl-D-erythritol 4-phosphate cytidylyltransferase [Gammaproteobacteria bacterium]
MNDKSDAKFWAVVPAAGSGQRMQSKQPKQYLNVNGRTIIESSLRVLLNCEQITRVVVCTAPRDRIWPSLEVSGHAKIINVNGGSTRARSVLNGLQSQSGKSAESEWVLIHDAARPCLSSTLLNKLINELQDDPVGGLLATPVQDTLKLLNRDQRTVQETLDRSLVWQAQTPQMFRFGLLLAALENGLNTDQQITDEASAMELAGHHPRIVESDWRNLKVTQEEDLQLVEFLTAD